MFNEVFFTDAPVPTDYRLGDEGNGWLVAMGTLGPRAGRHRGHGHRTQGRPGRR